jgi:hypothetical protein
MSLLCEMMLLCLRELCAARRGCMWAVSRWEGVREGVHGVYEFDVCNVIECVTGRWLGHLA